MRAANSPHPYACGGGQTDGGARHAVSAARANPAMARGCDDAARLRVQHLHRGVHVTGQAVYAAQLDGLATIAVRATTHKQVRSIGLTYADKPSPTVSGSPSHARAAEPVASLDDMQQGGRSRGSI